jgi:predicted phosphodiesterase
MKVAVFSDVQGNLPAMEVVVEEIQAWQPDLVVMNGDLVNRGPLSLECLLLFEDLRTQDQWVPLKGNHEDYVLACRYPEDDPIEAEMRRFADWTLRQLGDRADWMGSWADHLTLSAPGTDQWVHISHGTLAGNRRGISASIPDADLEGQLPADIALFVTAHTHKVHERHVHQTKILNIGSVGSPFDGDTRASYARLSYAGGRWSTRIQRLAYDRKRTERDFHQSGFLAEGGPLAQVIFAEWQRAELLMPHWKRAFLQQVRQGEIGLQDAVDRFLCQLS